MGRGVDQVALKGPANAPVRDPNPENTGREKKRAEHDPNTNGLLLCVTFPWIPKGHVCGCVEC